MKQSTICAMAFALAATLSSQSAWAANEEVAGAGLSLDFGQAALSGSGKVLRAGHVPVLFNGSTVYLNLEFDLEVGTDGFGAMLKSAAPANGPAASTLPSTVDFKVGNYTGKDPYFVYRSNDKAVNNPNCSYTLTSPAITIDGRRMYVLTVNRPVNNPLVTAPACPLDANQHQYVWLTGPAAQNTEIGTLGRSSYFLANASQTYAYGKDTLGDVFRVFQNGNVLQINYVNGNADPITTSYRTIVLNYAP